MSNLFFWKSASLALSGLNALDALIRSILRLRRPFSFALRELKASYDWSMVRFRIKDLGCEDDGFIVQQLIMHLRAFEVGQHSP